MPLPPIPGMPELTLPVAAIESLPELIVADIDSSLKPKPKRRVFKFLVFLTVAGAAVYGAYAMGYLQDYI